MHTATSQAETGRLRATFEGLDRVTARLVQTLPTLEAMEARTSVSWALSVHTLAHAAVVKLHAPFARSSPSSQGKLVASVRTVASLLQRVDVGGLVVDPSVVVRHGGLDVLGGGELR